MAYNFTAVEKKWQTYWLANKCFRALEPDEAGDMPKAYVLDMFPYPSGAGLHVGHPEGYTATDIYCRYLRMRGYNVLHPMGWDAFGLPAEQYAIKTNTHPRVTTEQNIATFRRQIQMLGLSYDWDREIDTTDPKYYRWTQWIFLQLYNSYFDPLQRRAMPIGHLVNELQNDNYKVAPDGSIVLNPTAEGMEAIGGEAGVERRWAELTPAEQRAVIDGQRLAYTDEVPVNWCPALGTVLSNEEVIDGRSEVGGYPVERRPMRQWMLRITAYADRLLEDLEGLEWPESLKEMQRNWIGRSTGAEVDFELAGAGDDADVITVFTTRPDTLYGATFLVLAPEHPLVDVLTTPAQRPAVDAYRAAAAAKSERDRLMEAKTKSGVFTGGYAVNPMTRETIPVWIADYVLMGYGTGAIMAVPAHDERDFEFARQYGLPVVPVVRPVDGNASAERCFTGEGIAVNSPVIDGLPTEQAKRRIIEVLEREGDGRRRTQYKLRDWLFSRQRYWGEPFPILLDEQGNHYPLPEDQLPLELPPMDDFKPTGTPEPPLSKAKDWVVVKTDRGTFYRETNTMPQWAGSCWYYLRYIDPHNDKAFVDPAKERYWMAGPGPGGVDLYVGGVEHAVLHLLYARFWHKVLYDLGHVSTPEPFRKLVNQGLILGETEYHFFEDEQGRPVSAAEVTDIDEENSPEHGIRLFGIHRATGKKLYGKRIDEVLVEKTKDGFVLKANPAVRVDARSFKMSKSRGNVVNPDDIVRDYGADVLRLYEMYMGPLEATKPWSTRDITGMHRFVQGVYRNLVGDEDESPPRVVRYTDEAVPDALERQLHRATKKVGEDIESLRFNTAIAELIKLNNEATKLAAGGTVPRAYAERFTLLLAPFAPHLAEEIWQRLGHTQSLARHPWPPVDPAKLVDDMLELPVQVNGKLRGKVVVPAAADEADIFKAALAVESVKPWVEGKPIKKSLYVKGKLVNFVVG
ncbi:MAG: leucine--tRNA ligase [Tepidisphaerales bacterium]